MSLIKKKTDLVSVVSYLILFVLFLIFSSVGKTPSVYSVAVYSAAIFSGASPLVSPLIFIAAFLALGDFGLLPAAAISCGFLSGVAIIYSLFKSKIKYEIFLYTAVSLIGFLFLKNTDSEIALSEKIIIAGITLALSPICIITFDAVKKKGLKYKFSFEEYVCLAAFVAVSGIGISELISPEVYKGVAVITILFCAYFYRTGITSLISSVLGIALSVYYAKTDYVAIFTIWGIFAQAAGGFSRYLSALSVPLADYLIQTVFAVYPNYGLENAAAICSGALLFCLIPASALKSLKESLFAFREKQLSREAINRNRVMTANRLYELSGVFTEIAAAFGFLKKEADSDEKIKNSVRERLISDVCLTCEHVNKCKEKGFPRKKDIESFIEIGMAKNKVSFIDVPNELSENCRKLNDLIFGLNKMLAEIRIRKIDELNYKNGRELLSKEAEGVAEILKGLALDTGTTLNFRGELEKSLSEEFYRNGISVSEVLIYGESDSVAVSLIVVGDDYPIRKITEIVSKILKSNMYLYEKADLTLTKFYLSFKKCAELDAVFGVANGIKNGKKISGDTHAVTKISGDKFLVALSDGMGSGKTAETVSSVSLSLIESFYKAGLNSDLILNTVNKLLAVNSDDTFTALDIAVVDLKNNRADFIKYGSPYGFLITRSGIKIVEGSNLPLGILEELSPSVCSSELSDGDVILLLSDGISDSFKSSSELVDFLRTLPAFNPQSLADSVLKKAVENYGGEMKDDLTALAVRIFKTAEISA